MIKSFTSLEQSCKLAEILPIESADMYYALSEDESMNMICFGKPQGFFDKTQVAWSLAALLCVLPRIEDLKPVLDLEINCVQYPTDIDLGVMADNPVDACYEMIIKLHELNLL